MHSFMGDSVSGKKISLDNKKFDGLIQLFPPLVINLPTICPAVCVCVCRHVLFVCITSCVFAPLALSLVTDGSRRAVSGTSLSQGEVKPVPDHICPTMSTVPSVQTLSPGFSEHAVMQRGSEHCTFNTCVDVMKSFCSNQRGKGRSEGIPVPQTAACLYNPTTFVKKKSNLKSQTSSPSS